MWRRQLGGLRKKFCWAFKGIRTSHSSEYTGMAFFVEKGNPVCRKGIPVPSKGSRVYEIGNPVPPASSSLPKGSFSFAKRYPSFQNR